MDTEMMLNSLHTVEKTNSIMETGERSIFLLRTDPILTNILCTFLLLNGMLIVKENAVLVYSRGMKIV